MTKEQIRDELDELFEKEKWTIDDHYRYKKLSNQLLEIEREKDGKHL